MKSKFRFLLICVTGCLVLAVVWGLVIAPETTLAKGKPSKEEEERALFDVTSDVGSDIEIIGVYDPDNPDANEDGIVIGLDQVIDHHYHAFLGLRWKMFLHVELPNQKTHVVGSRCDRAFPARSGFGHAAQAGAVKPEPEIKTLAG